MYFDAHIHLVKNSEIKKAQENGVVGFILNATSPLDWNNVLNFSKKEKNVYPCIGIHPWFTQNLFPSWDNEMDVLLQNNPFLMVGEIGLDYLKNNKEEQIVVFEKCLALAQKHQRPVHIHCVKAWHDMLRILKKYSLPKILFHKFSGSLEVVNRLCAYNSFFSINKKNVIDILPFDKILTETDSPSKNMTPNDLVKIVQTLGINVHQLQTNFQNFISPFDTLKKGKTND